MPRDHFTHVTTWVFDLDNTLYPPEARLFDEMETKMNAFIIRELGVTLPEAEALRAQYWKSHGTTLAGLMDCHGLAPEAFMEDVHDIDLSALAPDPGLARAIDRLPGRKIVYTNGSRKHAERVTDARGLGGLFDAMYGLEHARYIPKPHPEAFATVIGRDGLAPESAAMFEDDPRNLAVPHELGMRTVLVGPGDAGGHIHHQTVDLGGFLSQLT